MSNASVLEIQRVTLVAATPYEVTPPKNCSSLSIGNETGGDLLIASDPTLTQYGTLGDGNLMEIDLAQSGPGVSSFIRGQVNLYLQSSGGGAVALYWS